MAFKITDQNKYDRLIGKTVLLFIKESYRLTEVKVIEITQHRIRVKPFKSEVVSGVRKEDVMLLPISTSRNRLNNFIKNATTCEDVLQKYLDSNAYKLS